MLTLLERMFNSMDCTSRKLFKQHCIKFVCLYQSALTLTLGGFRIPWSFDSMPLWRFSPQESSDEHGDPNHTFGPVSIGTSEFRQQDQRWRAGAPPFGPRPGAGRPVAQGSRRAERHGPAN